MEAEVAVDADGYVRRLKTPGAHSDHETHTDIEYGVALPRPWPEVVRFPQVVPARVGTASLDTARQALARTLDAEELIMVCTPRFHIGEALPDTRVAKVMSVAIDTMSGRRWGVNPLSMKNRIDLVGGTEKAVAFGPSHPFADDRSAPGPHEIGGLWALDALGGLIAAEPAGDEHLVQVNLLDACRPLALPGMQMDTTRIRAFDLRVTIGSDGRLARIVVPTPGWDVVISNRGSARGG